MPAPRFVIAGGGTGGHVAPAIALADEISSRFGRDAVHFLCSGNAVERSMLGHAGYDLTELPVARPRGTLRSKATTVVSSAMAVPAARRKLRELDADALICAGGYASLPGAMAAGLMRLPVFLLESNAVPGKVTRALARLSRECFAHMPLTRPLDCPVSVLGTPVRKAFNDPVAKPDARRALGMFPHLPTLLVMGGSQGARAINDAILATAALMGELADRIQVLHLTGPACLERARQAWRDSGVHHRVSAFTNNTATWLAAADLAITRAGAGTISELCALAVPMALVPYPAAADNHQHANAEWIARSGAGVIVPEDSLDARRVLELIQSLLLQESAREAASQAAVLLAKPHAASRILDAILAGIDASGTGSNADLGQRAAA